MAERLLGIGMTSLRTRDRMVSRLKAQGIRDERVLRLMRLMPRHLFIDEALGSRAYEDTALPIGYGQTISQPYIVARMTEVLIADKEVPLGRVLEVGGGCGYQTAILAQLAKHVYSVELLRGLATTARRRLSSMGIHNAIFRCGDGHLGWPEHAPYDAILVAAAPAEIPARLYDQLAVGGRMIIPVGDEKEQRLNVIYRTNTGLEREILELVSFVPFLGCAT